MASNNLMVFPSNAGTSFGVLTAANTAVDGTGTVTTLRTAGGTAAFELIKRANIRPMGTNVATVLRLFINNGSTNATAANNILIKEITLAATTASNTTELIDYSIPINIPLQTGYVLNATLGTAVAGGIAVTIVWETYA